MTNALVKEMLDNTVHIGHKRQYWSAKMRDYLFGIQNHTHVFDLIKTADRLEAVKGAITELSSKGKSLLIVGTKLQARELVREVSLATNCYYIDNKWVPGILTNFPTIKRRITTYNKIEKDFAEGGMDGLTKKEKSQKLKELDKLRKAYEGIKDMRRTPDAIFVIDGNYESLATAEANKLKLPLYALLGSTGNIDLCTDFVPCNVNSIKSLSFILTYLKPAFFHAKKENLFKTDRTAQKSDNSESEAETETAVETSEGT